MTEPLRDSVPLARIRSYGHRCLRQNARPAEPGSPETSRLLDLLWNTLAADDGVGLAAPQIGVARRVVVIRDPGQPREQQRLDLVNPIIKASFGPLEAFEEGCLSFPGLYTGVIRPAGAEVEYQDAEGRSCRLSDEGLVARIVQHEIDHLDGILFVDRLPRWKKLLLAPRLLLVVLGGYLAEVRHRK